jgi:hypothetical protein
MLSSLYKPYKSLRWILVAIIISILVGFIQFYAGFIITWTVLSIASLASVKLFLVLSDRGDRQPSSEGKE